MRKAAFLFGLVTNPDASWLLTRSTTQFRRDSHLRHRASHHHQHKRSATAWDAHPGRCVERTFGTGRRRREPTLGKCAEKKGPLARAGNSQERVFESVRLL